MSALNDAVGYIKYSGKAVGNGVISAKAAGDALIGLDGIVRFFNSRQSRAWGTLEYEVPVSTEAGSWLACVLAPFVIFGGAYLTRAAQKMADKDFDDVGFSDVFRTSLSALQHLILLVKHTGKVGGWDFSKVKWRKGNSEAGITNDAGEVLYIPARYLSWYAAAPIALVRKLTSSVKAEQILIVGVKSGTHFEEVTVDEKDKALFDDKSSAQDDLDAEVMFPELEHGDEVRLEGKLIRGNLSNNSMGLEYQGLVLPCVPYEGSVKQYRPALFDRCIVEGTVNRYVKPSKSAEKRPTIIVKRVTPLEQQPQRSLI